MVENLQQILTRYWGHTHFRPIQEDIIRSVMDGKDTLGLMPTGGGKSVCFQVPGIAKDGICLVISPLVALMKDQLEFLTMKGIRAGAVNSFMTAREIGLMLDNSIHGGYKFLYVSPERLTNALFLSRLQEMKVNLIAVDEAHCISQWGYNFRPAYLRISEIRAILPEVPMLALTASATPEVVKDIQEKLQFRAENVFKVSFTRKNLAYVVLREDSKYERLLRIANNVKGSGIIYVRNRNKTEEIAGFLQQNHISAEFYHAGLHHEERSKKQENWFRDKVRVMVSTNAFGMGINKPNVRFVVHLDLPDSIESYFQEAGRAGRDEKKAYAILLYNEHDRLTLERNIEQSFPPQDEIKKTYSALCSYFQLAPGTAKGTGFDFDMQDFCKRYSLDLHPTLARIKILEKEGYILATDAFYRPSRVQILINHKDLYKIQVENPAYDAFMKLLLRSYGGIFTNYMQINEAELSRSSALPQDEITKILLKLDKANIISFIPRSSKPQIIFTEEVVHPGNLTISHKQYDNLKENAIRQMEWLISYATGTTECRSEFLLSYFGERDTVRCGICDVCLERNKLELSELEFEKVSDQLKEQLLKQPLSLTDLVHGVHQLREDKVLKTVQWLIDNGRLQYNEDNKLIWKG